MKHFWLVKNEPLLSTFNLKMTYAYVRVSTEKQTIENQRYEISQFAAAKKITITKWFEETISASKKIEERLISTILRKLKSDDILIVSEISRMGRNLMQIMSILHLCMERKAKVYAIKEGYELGNNINSKVLAFAFGLSAEIERNLISLRTKEALARLKANGKKLGRPCGSQKKSPKLLLHEEFIRRKLSEGAKQVEIARLLKVHRHTVKKWMDENILSN
ncbi:MAG: master DNA invertase Mpi family serine-type recombinase [Sediminibacterium magnilacihabitans]|jgi:putative DNA-invertase from lambdoid prophage Rac|nr:master DNA invertase Mpi family serine-type recombinase [Sediminibacterium magnilacihabitans]